MLKQQTTTIKNTKTPPIVTNNFPKKKTVLHGEIITQQCQEMPQ